jgi:Holliday junction DNA helicase RuvA
MIERLTGTLVSKAVDGVVLSVAGVGFQLETSGMTLRDAPAAGSEVTLVTHLHVRDDAIQLFGFSTEEERDLFRLFIGVSKIGPKLALAALSARRPVDLRRALAAGDVALFASVPGIGRKTAERMILELREKMGDLWIADSSHGTATSPEAEEAVLLARSALVELGYTVLEADKLLALMDGGLPVEELVRRALAGGR